MLALIWRWQILQLFQVEIVNIEIAAGLVNFGVFVHKNPYSIVD